MPEITNPTSPAFSSSRGTDLGVNTPICSMSYTALVAIMRMRSPFRRRPSTTRTSITTPT